MITDESLIDLPDRYRIPWKEAFLERAVAKLSPGCRILDMGSGRTPILPPELRPVSCIYVGLDVSADELRLAPPGSYDDSVVSDITARVEAMQDSFDVILSWQVLEHVRSLDDALENARAYLQPNGQLLAKLSGRFSVFGLINSVVPGKAGKAIMERLLGRPRDTVFPAYYHHCWHSRMLEIMENWSDVQIDADFRGANYFGFSKSLQQLYLQFENWAESGGRKNLATHYVIEATR